MQTVRIDKNKLSEILSTNMETHRMDYEDAVKLYLKDFDKQLRTKLSVLEAGSTPTQHFRDMPVPESHVEDYSRVLKMLDLSEDETITLTQQEFTQYVQDEWRWKTNFDATNATYRSKGL